MQQRQPTNAPHNHPTVAIVIPVLNEELFLERCLASVLAQTESPTEVVVVDNGSTDSSVSIAAAFARAHPHLNLRILRQTERRGLIPTRDAGFDACESEVMGRIDADTVLHHQWVESVRAVFANPAAAAATGPVAYLDLPVKQVGLLIDRGFRRLTAAVAPRHFPFLYGSNMAIRQDAWALIRSEVCSDSRDEMHEDLDLSIHLRRHDLLIRYAPRMVAAVTARCLDLSPIEFRRYRGRFAATNREHRVNSPTSFIPSSLLAMLYRPLRAVRHRRVAATSSTLVGVPQIDV